MRSPFTNKFSNDIQTLWTSLLHFGGWKFLFIITLHQVVWIFSLHPNSFPFNLVFCESYKLHQFSFSSSPNISWMLWVTSIFFISSPIFFKLMFDECSKLRRSSLSSWPNVSLTCVSWTLSTMSILYVSSLVLFWLMFHECYLRYVDPLFLPKSMFF